MKEADELTPRGAAKLLGVHVKTVRRWCREAVEGQPSRLEDVRQDLMGRFYINRSLIESAQKSPRRFFSRRMSIEGTSGTSGTLRRAMLDGEWPF
jgi:hypothetical protein